MVHSTSGLFGLLLIVVGCGAPASTMQPASVTNVTHVVVSGARYGVPRPCCSLYPRCHHGIIADPCCAAYPRCAHMRAAYPGFLLQVSVQSDKPKPDKPKPDKPKPDKPKSDNPSVGFRPRNQFERGAIPKSDKPKSDKPKSGSQKSGEPKYYDGPRFRKPGHVLLATLEKPKKKLIEVKLTGPTTCKPGERISGGAVVKYIGTDRKCSAALTGYAKVTGPNNYLLQGLPITKRYDAGETKVFQRSWRAPDRPGTYSVTTKITGKSDCGDAITWSETRKVVVR